MDNTEKKDKQRFTANYNGQPIQPGEVMVAFEYKEVESENYTNPECIKTLRQGGQSFKSVYKAVQEKWEKDAKSAMNLHQNEVLGHYDVPNSVSMDAMEDKHGLELATVPSAEDEVIKKESRKETLDIFAKLVRSIIEKSAKLGLAVLLQFEGIKGKEFYKKMGLTHNPANRLRQQAEDILDKGLSNVDLKDIKNYKSKDEESYKEKAEKMLDELIMMYR